MTETMELFVVVSFSMLILGMLHWFGHCFHCVDQLTSKLFVRNEKHLWWGPNLIGLIMTHFPSCLWWRRLQQFSIRLLPPCTLTASLYSVNSNQNHPKTHFNASSSFAPSVKKHLLCFLASLIFFLFPHPVSSAWPPQLLPLLAHI